MDMPSVAPNESESRRTPLHPFASRGHLCLPVVWLYVLGERWDPSNENSRCLFDTLHLGNDLLYVLA
jgi:hypothetical protein